MNKLKLRITFVTVSLDAGGAEKALSVLATDLARRGHDVDIILFANRRTRFFECEGVPIRYTEQTFYTGEEEPHWERIGKLRKALVEAKSHIIVSFLMLSNIYVHFAKKDEMIHIACERDDPYLIPLNDFVYSNRLIAMKEADGVVFQTHYAQNFYAGNLPANVAVIHNAIAPIVAKKNSNQKEKYVIAVGRVAKQKNYKLLLQSFKHFHSNHPEYILKVFGSKGDDYQNFLESIDELGLQDFVVHFDAIKNIHDEIINADIFLMTSNYEGLSNAVLEAFEIGTPVVCVPLPGMIEAAFIDECNVIIAERDVCSISNAMQRLITNTRLRELLIYNAKKTAKKFYISNIVPKWERFLKETVFIKGAI